MERIAVVTGGNRGIGLEIARQLGASGVHVVLTSRDKASGEEAAASLRASGLRAEHAALDVTSDDDARALSDLLRSTFGGIDILVNNAGITMDGFNGEVARKTLETNFFGALRVTEHLLPLLREGGRIVMVSSGLADRSRLSPRLRERLAASDLGKDGLVSLMRSFVSSVERGDYQAEGWPTSAYCVSKIGLNRLAEILGEELSKDGRRILCNAASPGWVRTAMGGKSAPRSVEEGAETPVWLALLSGDSPQGGFFHDKALASW